ncbi:MAG: hypothetical protein Q8927_02590 [Bacteroidota bacterium]|nr:hypothetical protein [Bacteroidota bacterium]MDP4215060.1 hypothetical protein [Bacteroidota bacterium]MDP4244291.1 hypothetical protein [Bacteroidota bacterium]MDP4252779.1 hypothetical protein [Bacteroidota bacterium]MDP4257536.1 hypothetical protein [Bacteroidota bacterium]
MIKQVFLAALLLTASYGYSQDCQSFFFFQKNKTIEMSISNKKGEPNGKQVYQVSDVTIAGGTTTATIATEMFDKNGNSLAKSNSSVQCHEGTIMVDMRMMLPPRESEQYAASARTQSFLLEYPTAMHVGDALKDGNLSMQLNMPPPGAGAPPGPPGPPGFGRTINMAISNRKVEAQESVTTPAGTWNCYKISFKCRMTVKNGVPFAIPVNLDGFEWYAPGFGVVKSQTKNSSTQITSIK